MSARPARRCRGTRGSVAVFIVALLPALLIAGGLVLDGGRQLQARRDADGAASAAARAAVQLSPNEARQRRLDPTLATTRAAAALDGLGASGSVSVSGQIVTVTVVRTVDNLILPGGRQVTGQATAVPSRGVTSGG